VGNIDLIVWAVYSRGLLIVEVAAERGVAVDAAVGVVVAAGSRAVLVNPPLESLPSEAV
jgi:hypothetical protein